jgi:hypothetical protein
MKKSKAQSAESRGRWSSEKIEKRVLDKFSSILQKGTW